MVKASVILILLLIAFQSNVKAQKDKKPLREYSRYDTIFPGFPMPVTAHKLKYDRPVRDIHGITYLISDKTEEIIKLENGVWKIWNRGIEETPYFLHANSTGNVFVVASGKGFGWKLYQLNDTVWNKISDNFPTWPLTSGADGVFYCLKESKDANNIKYKSVQFWKNNAWNPIEINTTPQLFYEESIKLYIPPDGTVFAVVRKETTGKKSHLIHQWKNNQWKMIGEFPDEYISLSTQGIDKLNRFFVTYFKDNQAWLRRWDGITWTAVQLPNPQPKYANLTNNLSGDLFIEIPFPAPATYYQLQGDEWMRSAAQPGHIIPKYMKEVYPQKEGHYYKTEYGSLYDLGTEFTVKKRELKEYPFVIPASLEKTLPANLKEHLAQFRYLIDNGKLGIASSSSNYEIIHAVFDSIRVEKNYMSENEYKEYGYTDYQPYVLALYTGGKSMDVDILAINPRPNKSDQVLQGTITRISTCRKCNGTGSITEKTVKAYTPEKTEVIKIKDRYKSASGDLVEKTYSWTESTPGVSTYDIKTGPCNCKGGKIENTIHYFFDNGKQHYRN